MTDLEGNLLAISIDDVELSSNTFGGINNVQGYSVGGNLDDGVLVSAEDFHNMGGNFEAPICGTKNNELIGNLQINHNYATEQATEMGIFTTHK